MHEKRGRPYYEVKSHEIWEFTIIDIQQEGFYHALFVIYVLCKQYDVIKRLFHKFI